MPMAPEQVVLAALELAQGGRFDEVRDLFVPQLQDFVVPEALETAWDRELATQGPIVSVGAPVSEPAPGDAAVVRVPVCCERGGFTLIAPVSPDGQLGGLQIAPLSAASPIAPWEPPDYADPTRFDEE